MRLNLIWSSIFRPGAYQEMTRVKLGKAIGIFLLYYLVLSLINGTILIKGLNQQIADLQRNYDWRVPPFTFDGKELHVRQSEPIYLASDPHHSVIIDTLHDRPDIPADTDSAIVLGKTTFYAYSQSRGLQAMNYEKLDLAPFDKDSLKHFITVLPSVLTTLVIVWEILSIVGKFILITLFSLLALLLASIGRISLTYRQAWLIAGFALVPAFLIHFINGWIQSPWFTLAFWVAIFTYLYHGVNSFRSPVRR
jgi:hypothetical protein